MVTGELTRELGPFYVEAETHGVEVISILPSSTSAQQSESIIGCTLTEADGF